MDTNSVQEIPQLEGKSWLASDHVEQATARKSAAASDLLSEYMRTCRSRTLEELRAIVPSNAGTVTDLYRLMLDYPLRDGKALRPALAIASCRALGGSLDSIAKSAAVIELYHNAFLIHDDIEDGSEKRRDRPTLHRQHGTAIAINVGDAMLALALEPLLDNMRVVGMGSALRILELVARMARESAEGQALELSWIARHEFRLADRDYLRMVHKKTGWYTFITPMVVGAMVAGAPGVELDSVGRLAVQMGLAFQIQDDILNLSGDEKLYGKEILGDLWEGKHTLILLHALRAASRAEHEHALAILKKPRPGEIGSDDALRRDAVIASLVESEQLTPAGAARLRNEWATLADRETKTASDVAFLFDLVQRNGSIEYARRVAERRAARARRTLHQAASWRRPSVHYDFLDELVAYIAERER